jgi:hypothetical protein
MPRIIIIGIVLLIAAGGCATPYQQRGFRGGYSDARIGQDTVLVSFKGNGYTSKERVQLYLLYRCAEVTRQHGYDYFVVANGSTETAASEFSSYSATTTASAAMRRLARLTPLVPEQRSPSTSTERTP